MTRKTSPRSLVSGRRGKVSVIDCLTQILWSDEDGTVPAYSFAELSERVSRLRGSQVADSTVRSIIYRREEWFEQTTRDGHLKWRLSPAARRAAWPKRS
jgi:hypothetical protein